MQLQDPTHDAETDAIVAELEKAGLVETYTNDEGKVVTSSRHHHRIVPVGPELLEDTERVRSRRLSF
jgi:hypothetical protein